MARRLSTFFGLTKSPSGNADIDSSVHSSHTDISSFNYSSDITDRRRSSFAIGLGLSEQSDEEIDTMMRNLYLPPEVLERNCLLSVKGLNDRESLSPGSKQSLDKFGNRIDVSSSSDRNIDDIGQEYFTPDFDPIAGYVQQISDMDPDELNEFFMEKILEIDEDKDIVIADLSDMIEASYGDLMDCMRNVNDVDIDLTRAVIQIADSRGSLQRGSTILTKGALRIVALQKRRENMSILRDAANSLKYTKDIFKAMNLHVRTGDLGRAAEYLRLILKGISRNEYKEFKALTNVKVESLKTVSIIKQKTDKALQRLCCRKFASTEYSNIIRAFLILDDLYNSGSIVQNETDYVNCIESLPQKIQQYHMDDIDNCLHTALLELIYASQHKKQRVAAAVGSHAGANSAEMMEFAELPLYMLYQRITPDSVASSIMRSCELFAESVHTHFMISEWHHQAQLNGCPVDDESDLIWTESDMMNLQNVLKKLLESRTLLWEDLLRGLVEMLGSVTLTAVVTLDDFLAVIWAIESMVTLGNEFCGSKSTQLLSLTESKSREYVQFIHLESFQVLQQMLDSDPWEHVPIKLSDYGGVLGILKSKAQVPRNEHSLFKAVLRAEEHSLPGLGKIGISFSNIQSLHVAEKLSILESFQEHGNPFHFMTQYDNEEDPSETSLRLQQSITEISTVLSKIFREDNSMDPSTNKQLPSLGSRRNMQLNDTLVVTQSTLNGLSNITALYLQMMDLIPKSAFEIWLKFCEIFDYYICYIFNAFLPLEDRNRFMGKPSKMSLPAPDQAKDFEALYKFLDKSLYREISRPNSNGTSSNVNPNSIDSENTTNSNHSGSDTSHNKAQNIEKVKLSSLLTTPGIFRSGEDLEILRELTYRIVASESCWFAARILNEMKDKLVSLLHNCESACDTYVSQYQLISSQLRSLIYKSSCPQLIKSSWILTQIEGGMWESKKMRDTHHDWVNKVVATSNELWDYFCNGIAFSETTPFVKEQLWLELCQAIFDTVLDGFSKIRKLSNEGRALMTMDIAALQDGLDSIHSCRPPRGKHHVNNFIRGTYLSEEDTLAWVQENWQSFSYRHVHGLLTLNLTSVLSSKRLKEAIAFLDNLYAEQVNQWQIPRYADLFDTKGKEESGTLKSITNLGQRLLRSPQAEK